MRSFDAVVIGGGCMGTAALYHLTQKGCTNVLLLEADSLGSGSTSKAAGGIRVQHSDELNTRLALSSIPEFEQFEELTGTPINFHQVGYLFVVNNEEDMEEVRRAAEVQQSLGAPTEILTPEEAGEKVPGMRIDDLVGASFCPIEGYATPEAVVQGYASAARKAGATVENSVEVLEILTDESGVTGVRTSKETIQTRQVIITAGVGSTAIAATAGVDLPLTAAPRSIYYSGNSVGVPADAPMTIDFETNFYFHREGEGLILGSPAQDLEEMSELAYNRLPTVEDAEIQSSWWGNYEMSPDHNAMVGSASVEGLHYATGFSGHGFQQAPAIGVHLAESVLGLEHSIDLSVLSADRFARGETRAEKFII